MKLRQWTAPLVLLGLVGCASLKAPMAAGSKNAASAASAKPQFTQADFLGHSGADLDALLGSAQLIRKEGKGEFRRYAFADCAVIIILYPDESGTAVAGYIDAAAKAAGEDKPNLDACLAKGAPAPERPK
ncbi:MAG TPA: hypothetical protein VNH64_01495 [Parvularculaceae bacterium]|nr:hypothetical protein [Parvularculaceae bacterium]